MENARTPITSNEEAAFDHLKQYPDATGDDESFTRADTVAHLMDQGVERADARAHIEQLLLKGISTRSMRITDSIAPLTRVDVLRLSLFVTTRPPHLRPY